MKKQFLLQIFKSLDSAGPGFHLPSQQLMSAVTQEYWSEDRCGEVVDNIYRLFHATAPDAAEAPNMPAVETPNTPTPQITEQQQAPAEDPAGAVQV